MSKLTSVFGRLFRRRAKAAPLSTPEAARSGPRRRGARKWWIFPLVVLILAGAAGGAWWLRTRAAPGSGLTEVYTVERGSVTASVSCTGEVYAPRRADLAFDVNKIALTELAAVAGNPVNAGDVLARIDPTSLERAVLQAEADLTVAQDNLEKVKNPYTKLDLTRTTLAVDQAKAALIDAQQNLDDLLKPDTSTAESALRDAAVALKSAQTQLELTQNDPNSAAKLRTLEYELTWYRNNYGEAQVKFDKGQIDQQKLDWEYSNVLAAEERLKAAQLQAQSSLSSAQNQAAKAWDTYQKAQEALTKLQAEPDPAELAKAKNQVTQAEYNLAKAEDDLATIEAGPKAKDIQVAQAKVDSAQATLATAHASREAATMTAPFTGTVVSVGAAVGDLVSSSTVVVVLADLSTLRVRAAIDETDISQVQIGQDTTITFDAFPGSRFRGKVLEVPLQGKLSQNILTYDVPVSLESTGDASIKPGMTANISIVAGRRQNVLLVPVMAVQRGTDGNVVRLQRPAGAEAELTQVMLGLSDGVYVEVRQGLNEGDRILVDYQQQTTSQQQPQQQQQRQQQQQFERAMPVQQLPNPGPGGGR